jgi:hypothetical protein
MFRGRVEEYWLPHPFACFPLTSPAVRLRMPLDSTGLYGDTFRMCSTYCFTMATMVSQKFLNIAFIWALSISFLPVFDKFCLHKRLFADVRSCKQRHTHFCAKFLKLGKPPVSMMGGNLVVSYPLGSKEIRWTFSFRLWIVFIIPQFCTICYHMTFDLTPIFRIVTPLPVIFLRIVEIYIDLHWSIN